jgi:hypothetical protein
MEECNTFGEAEADVDGGGTVDSGAAKKNKI